MSVVAPCIESGPKDRQFADGLKRSLIWLPEHGMGYYPVKPEDYPYDADYFAKYQGYAETELGRAITAFRVGLVRRHVRDVEAVVDVGIGCGAFVEARGAHTYGADINPEGIRWLSERGLLWPEGARLPNACFWDVLEHFPDPESIIRRVESHVFISVPVFTSAEHCAASRHFRRDEHYWYWTRDGLVRWFAGCGLVLLDESYEETRLGREDIGTFVFSRTSV